MRSRDERFEHLGAPPPTLLRVVLVVTMMASAMCAGSVRAEPPPDTQTAHRGTSPVVRDPARGSARAREAAAPTRAEAGARPAERPRSSSQRARSLLGRFGDEPEIDVVVRRAIAHAGLGGAADRWSRRARWANLVPDVRAQVTALDRRDSASRFREDFELDEGAGRFLRDSAQNDLVDESQARRGLVLTIDLDLGGLVFDRDELSASREARARLSSRESLAARVIDLYFDRRAAQLRQLLLGPHEFDAYLRLELRVRRYTAHLNALTGGWYARALSGGTP
jgi:hypothetical protein